MSSPQFVPRASFGKARVQIYDSRNSLGSAAAAEAAGLIQAAIGKAGHARVIVATGNSQLEMIDALTHCEIVNWKAVEVFHMDEYAGISPDHPASFRRWIRTRVQEAAHPARVHYLAADAVDLDAEMDRYARLLNSAPVHLALVGFGENGHIAFNDPPVADFEDPMTVKSVVLDERCRRQQVGEGHFPDMDSVPKEALTVTCSGLFRAEAWVSVVPEARKAEAVRDALEGPISTACPASIVRTHPNASVYLDTASAALLHWRAD